jgi:ribosomal protein L7/L12
MHNPPPRTRPVPPVSTLFDPEHPEKDRVGTIREKLDGREGPSTWVCEPYWPGDGNELGSRWRCLSSPYTFLLGETRTSRHMYDSTVIGVVTGTPAAPLWAEHNASLLPSQVAEVRDLARTEGRIHAIKRLRELTGCGFVNAKDYVDDLLAQIERDNHTLAETEQL